MKILMQPVQMISHFYPEEVPRPVKFRVKDTTGEFVEVKIERILYHSEQKVGQERWILYKCETILNGQKRLLELKFEKSSCRWILFKM
ncbi:MAG: hypothetical protein AB7G87_01415 [Clostridia bacterium]